jgi:hypothetical protein
MNLLSHVSRNRPLPRLASHETCEIILMFLQALPESQNDHKISRKDEHLEHGDNASFIRIRSLDMGIAELIRFAR